MSWPIRFALASALAALSLVACERSDAAGVPAKPEKAALATVELAAADDARPGEARIAQARTAIQTAAVNTAARAIPPLGPPVLNAQQRELYTQVFAAVEAGRWEAARTLLARGNHPVANKLFRWLELQLPRSGVAFEDIVQFVDQNPDWPSLDTISRRAEEALLDRPSNDTLVLAWFGTRNPLTPDGAMRYAEALANSGDRARADQVIRDHWVSGTFNDVQHKRWLERYRRLFTPELNWAKLDKLLWEGKSADARRVLPLVSPERRLLADARMRIHAGANAEAQNKRVPESLRGDSGLLFDRARAWRRANREAVVRDIFRSLPKTVSRPDLWWPERGALARRSLAAGDAAEGYRLANAHGMSPANGAPYLEAEFLAGWIALRRINQPKAALEHFRHVFETARYPVSRARGAYWMARAHEALADRDAAREWYVRAAEFHTAYYGQLANARLSADARQPWPAAIVPTPDERRAFDRSEPVRAARILIETREKPERARPFLVRLANVARTPAQHALVSEFAHQLGRNDLAVIVSKRSAQVAGVQLHDLGWPTMPISGERPEKALTYAIIRQESQFEPEAISRAGARGLMQLMPGTARAVAKGENVAGHNAERLFEPAYNLRIGRSYLATLVDDFGGSYVLAAAAYNAGPGRAREWMRTYGDPRSPEVDVVDWIEAIPFEETRTYVQRVMENLHVYRHNLQPTQVAVDVERDLRRGKN